MHWSINLAGFHCISLITELNQKGGFWKPWTAEMAFEKLYIYCWLLKSREFEPHIQILTG